jgi:hypothetical protein
MRAISGRSPKCSDAPDASIGLYLQPANVAAGSRGEVMHVSAQRTRSLALPVLVLVVVLACALLASDPRVALAGDDAKGGDKVALHITETGNADLADGSLEGLGRFTISGAVSDSGTTAAYRTETPATVLIRRVMVGKKGTFSLLLTIYKTRGVKLWTITSGTRAYAGLHGKGTEDAAVFAGDSGDFSLTGSVTRVAKQPQWLTALNARGDALNREYGLGKYARNTSPVTGGRVTVRIAGANDGRDVGDGSLAGTGHFTAAGAITDKGKALVYRTKKGALIILRYVTIGEKGTITFVVRIDTILATSRWTITAGTKGYKGLHGKGTERENAQYTVSTLTGSVSP